MWLKFPLIVLLFLCIGLLQASFLPYFNVVGVVPNLVFVMFFILVFFQKENAYYEGIFLVVTAGFFLDVFSPFYFGATIMAFLVAYLAIKAMIYFLKERQRAYLLTYFVVIFLISLICYDASWYVLTNVGQLRFVVGATLAIQLCYNVIFAYIGFYIWTSLSGRVNHDRQLTLFR